MPTGNALVLMFMKDFRTLYRKKASLIVEIILICIFVPLIWYGSYKINDVVSSYSDEYFLNPSNSSLSEIAKNFTFTMSIQPYGTADYYKLEDAINKTCGSIIFVNKSEKPDVIITVKKFSPSPPAFEYDLMLAKNYTSPYHNEPYVIPNIFGDDADDMNLGQPFSKSKEAVTAQYCVDSAFYSLTSSPIQDYDKYFVKSVPAPNMSSFSSSLKLFVLLIAILIPLCLLIPTLITAAEICAEKENGVHRYMIVMGLPRYVFYLSHLIFAFIKMYLFIILGGGALIVFLPTVGIYTFILVFLIGHIFLGVVFVSSTIFKRSLFVVFMSIGYLALLLGVHLLLQNYINIYNSSLTTLLCFFNPISAYYYGLQHLFIVLDYKQSLQFFTYWDYYLPFSVPIFCLLFHSIFYILLAFYFDYVLPIDDSQKRHPLFFIGKKFEGEKEILEDELPEARCKVIPSDTPSEMVESSLSEERGNYAAYFEADTSTKAPDIEVSKLVKKWSNDEIAVKNVSFRAYRNEVTALLGHNGAGKSTIFGILTGSVRPTAGVVRIVGEPPAPAIGEDANVGFCPQWNPLFPYLTVEEHLAFYGDVKISDTVPPEEINTVLHLIGLEEDRKLRGSQLSGGMKRKLCVGIAMIGDSKVLLLDEPTAGIDPMARRTMLQVIEKAKEGRTILLTTHYMDEADFLSDRIIIMAKGEIVCNGSSDFLKARFATGFVLTIDLNAASESTDGSKTNYSFIAANILNVAIKHCDGARMDGPISRQFNLVLPYGSQRTFPKLFKEFENRKDSLQIESFDVRENNLEQIFIKVTDSVDSSKETEIHTKVEEFIQMKQNQTSSCFCLFALQFLGLVIRKLRYTLRHYIQTSLPLFLVLILLILLILNATMSSTRKTGQSDFYQGVESVDLSTYPEMKVFLGGEFDNNFVSKLESLSNVKLEKLKVSQKHSFFNNISRSYYDIPPFAFGIERSVKAKTIYYRHTYPNGVPLALNLLSNSWFSVGKPIKTTISIAPLDNIYSTVEEKHNYGAPIITIVVLIFPLVFCIPAMLHVIEIHQGTLHLYQRTSMPIFLYWFSAFVTDFVLALIPIAITTILIFSFQYFNIGCLLGYWISVLVTSFAFLSQAYVVSTIFKTTTWALVFLFSYNIILFGIVYLIEILISAFTTLDISMVSRILFPTFALNAFFTKFENLCHNKNVYIMEPFDYCSAHGGSDSCTSLTTDLIITFFCGVFYTVILFIIAYWRKIRKLLKCCKPSELSTIQEDSDVTEEKRKIDEKGMEHFAICTKDLRKDFGRDRIAVRNLSIGIKSGECFGLLGANGAGKSTTFNMLTAIIQPTDGIGVVNGINIEDKPSFGFCPQKDAVLGDLTVYETLMLFTRLNGIWDAAEIVECLMECLQLSHKQDNLAKNCSGGELRRLSLAVALITNSDVIMLDEPTAGVDPRTRRNVWELLIALRAAGTSQLLTSHSMEECEALCTRIGFINKGQLVGIGTSQYLKNRYGNTYMLSITMHGRDEPLAAKLNSGVQKEFNGIPISINGTFPTLTWTIRKTGTPLSEMYENLIAFIDRQPQTSTSKPAVKDFALVGTSLDEVFIAMTKSHIIDIPETGSKNTN